MNLARIIVLYCHFEQTGADASAAKKLCRGFDDVRPWHGRDELGAAHQTIEGPSTSPMFKSNTVYGTDGTRLERELRGQYSLERRSCGYCQRMHKFDTGARYGALSQILLEFECGHRPDIIMLRAQQTAEMQ